MPKKAAPSTAQNGGAGSKAMQIITSTEAPQCTNLVYYHSFPVFWASREDRTV